MKKAIELVIKGVTLPFLLVGAGGGWLFCKLNQVWDWAERIGRKGT